MASPQIDAGASARTRIATRLLPFLFLLYVANYLDRTNIAYATLGMKGDLGLTDSVFGTASGIFFIGYLGLQIPGALLVERWSARLLLAITLITWGALTTLTGFVRTPLELYGARFLLGAAEAGFFPGVIVYLSHWFIYQDRAKAVARFMAAIPIGFMLGGPIAGAILGVHWLGITGWRWLFLLEGGPAVVLGIATLFVLPDRPNEARWLRPNERDWITARLAEERRAKAHAEQMTIWQALRHPAVLMLTAGLFFTYTGGYAFWFWFPTMLQRLHRLDRCSTHRLGRRDSVCRGPDRNARPRLELRSHGRAALAFCHSSTDGRARARRVVFHPTFECAAHRGVHAARLRHCRLSAIVLGVAFCISHQFSRGRGGWLHQLHRQHRRIRRSENYRQPEPAHRLVQYGIHLHDRVLDDRVIAGAALPAGARDVILKSFGQD